MIFNNFLSLKYRQEFKFLTCLIVLSFILSLSGCATTETQRISSNNMHYKMNYKIINVILKNGLLIDLQDKSALYFREYNNKKNVIVYTTADTVSIPNDSLRISQTTKVIELNEVQKVTIEKRGTASAAPFILVGVAIILLAYFILADGSGGISVGP